MGRDFKKGYGSYHYLYGEKTKRTGFTLIEVLVVSVIFAALSVAVFSSVSMGLNVYKRIALSSMAYKDAVIVLEKLEKELANCIEFAGIDFEGGPENLEFCSIFNVASDGDEPLPTIGRLSYTFDKEKQVILKEKHAFPQSLKKTDGSGKIIASGLKKVNFSYFYRDQLTGDYEWNDYWLNEGGLPVGVKIEIQLSQGNGSLSRVSKVIFPPVAFNRVKQTAETGQGSSM